MLAHSFDRFYVVAKFKIPKIEVLKLTTIAFDTKCSYLNGTNMYINRVLVYCKKIVPYIKFYKRQIAYYNRTAYRILENEIGLILPNFPTDNRPKKRCDIGFCVRRYFLQHNRFSIQRNFKLPSPQKTSSLTQSHKSYGKED